MAISHTIDVPAGVYLVELDRGSAGYSVNQCLNGKLEYTAHFETEAEAMRRATQMAESIQHRGDEVLLCINTAFSQA